MEIRIAPDLRQSPRSEAKDLKASAVQPHFLLSFMFSRGNTVQFEKKGTGDAALGAHMAVRELGAVALNTWSSAVHLLLVV